MSCYIDAVGWRKMESQLKRLFESATHTDERAGIIALSRSGLVQSLDAALIARIHAFALQFRDVLKVYVVPDAPGRLLHAKGVGCLLTDGGVFVRVGSTNLTNAGMGGNKELDVTINERSAYEEMFLAVVHVTKGAPELTDHALMLEIVSGIEERRAADEGPPAGGLPVFFPDSREDQNAYEEAVAWLQGGLRVARQHQNDEFVVSFPLSKYIDARLISHAEDSDPETGIRIGGDRKSIHIPLLPESRKIELRKLNQRLGDLLSQYVVDVAGVLWCRPEWIPLLAQEWDDLVRKVDRAGFSDVLRQHLELLSRTIRCQDGRWLTIVRLFRHNPPSLWDAQRAERILESEDVRRCISHPAEAEKIVSSVILRDAADAVSKQMRLDYLMAQVELIGAKPHSYPHVPHDPRSVFEAILDLLIMGILPHVRAGGESRPRAHGYFAKELMSRFSSRISAVDLHKRALQYKEHVSRGRDETLPMAELWRGFVSVFKLDKEPIHWSEIIQPE